MKKQYLGTRYQWLHLGFDAELAPERGGALPLNASGIDLAVESNYPKKTSWTTSLEHAPSMTLHGTAKMLLCQASTSIINAKVTRTKPNLAQLSSQEDADQEYKGVDGTCSSHCVLKMLKSKAGHVSAPRPQRLDRPMCFPRLAPRCCCC